MRSRAYAFLVIFSCLSIISTNLAWAQSETRVLSIPTPNKQNSVKKPATDLVKDGTVLEVGEAAKMAENGFDLSTLNPVENKMWQNQSYPATDLQSGFPQGAKGVKFLSFEAATKFTSMMRVQSNDGSNAYFRLSLSRYSQPMMMRAALLRKLGYFIPSPKIYNNLKVTFDDEATKKIFLDQAQQDMGVDFESRKWIVSDNKTEHSIVLSSATLESVSSEFFDINWGLAPNPDDPGQVAIVQRFSRNRAYRALIFPFSIADVPESVNRYSIKFASVSTGYVAISYFMAHSFQACGYDDAQWILRRIQKLTLKDYEEIVKEANYPSEIAKLVLAKMVNRANSALQIFGLTPTVANPEVNITTATGLVAKGKVTKEFVDGYPQRFAHGERTSPYQEGDLGRYLAIDGKTSILSSVIDKLNGKLQLFTVDDAVEKYQKEYYQRIIDHIRNNPNQPMHKEVTSWGGPIAGFNVSASRHVATGTYSGSTAPVQLVDSFSINAGLGLFRALDGFDKYVPIGGANVSVAREYTHVRPILSIKEASKAEWKNLVVPRFMKNITEVLKSTDKKLEDGVVQKSLDAFINDLRDGEMFSITESIALTAYLQVSTSIDTLFGLQPFDFLNSVTFGADGARVILRQTTFHRVTSDRFNGVHVYVRDMKNKARGLEMNVNFFFHLLKIRSQSTEADIQSDGFLIDYNPTIAAESDPNSDAGKKFAKTREDLRMALLPLFRDNDTELLYARFANKKFVITHDLKAKEQKTKFLAWKYNRFQEDHLINIEYPRSEAHPDLDPKDEIVTLFSSKRGELKGRDLLGFVFDVVDGVLTNKTNGDFKVSRGMGDNPANVPGGKAYWRMVTTESDLTKNADPQYPSVAMIQHVWGGWSLSREKFFKVIDDVKKQFENTGISKYELINKNEFINMKSLDFYRITANLSVLGDGLDKVRDLILQPDADPKNPAESKFPLERLIKKMRCKNEVDQKKDKCNEKIRYVNDQEMFDDLLKLLGNGNIKSGKESYMDTCTIEQRRRAGRTTHADEMMYKGTRYECLSSWMRKLINLGHEFPSDKAGQTKWMTQVLAILDEQIPMPQILNYLGEENYIFLIRINGFRAGDEDGDLEYFSNSIGDPEKDYSYAGGLINLFVKKTGIMPTELDRTLGGFQ